MRIIEDRYDDEIYLDFIFSQEELRRIDNYDMVEDSIKIMGQEIRLGCYKSEETD